MARPVSINEEEVLAAARRVFMQHGYGASSVRLARAAGVSEGSLFRHFKTKTALFMKAMRSESGEPAWTENLMASVGRGDIRTTLETAGRQLLEHLQVVLPQVMMIRSSGILLRGDCHRDEKTPRPVQLARGLARYFRKEIELGRIVMSSPDTYAHAFLGALSHYVFCETLFNYRPAPPLVYVRTVVDAIVKTTAVPNSSARGGKRRKVPGR